MSFLKHRIDPFSIVEQKLYLNAHCVEICGVQLLYDLFEGEISKMNESDFLLYKKISELFEHNGALSYFDVKELADKYFIEKMISQEFISLNMRESPPQSVAPNKLADIEINVAQACNLGCDYCCVGKGRFGKAAHRMSVDTVHRAIDQLIERTDSSEHKITFFGGEPLLNFEVIKSAVLYANAVGAQYDRSFSYRILTNGTMFDEENSSFLKQHNFTVQVSLDGVGVRHDKWRIYVNGGGTFDLIVASLNKFFLGYRELVIRATMTVGNLNALDVYSSLIALGFCNVIVAHANGSFYSSNYSESDINELKSGYSELASHFLSEAMKHRSVSRIGAPFNEHIRVITSGFRKDSYCGAGVHFVGLSSRGEYSFCQDLAEEPLAAAGSINSGLDVELVGSYLARNASVDKKDVCRKCWARYVCGGGCAALAVSQNRNIETPYSPDCEMIRHNISLSIWIISRLQAECPDSFIELGRVSLS